MKNLLKATAAALVVYVTASLVSLLVFISTTLIMPNQFTSNHFIELGFVMCQLFVLAFVITHNDELTYSGKEVCGLTLLLLGPVVVIQHLEVGQLFQFGMASLLQIVCTTSVLYLMRRARQRQTPTSKEQG